MIIKIIIYIFIRINAKNANIVKSVTILNS